MRTGSCLQVRKLASGVVFRLPQGDVNGDGFDDLLIGAIWLPDGDAASAYVVFGGSGRVSATLELSSLDGNNGFASAASIDDYSGFSVAAAGTT